jgi:hypothetical protein
MVVPKPNKLDPGNFKELQEQGMLLTRGEMLKAQKPSLKGRIINIFKGFGNIFKGFGKSKTEQRVTAKPDNDPAPFNTSDLKIGSPQDNLSRATNFVRAIDTHIENKIAGLKAAKTNKAEDDDHTNTPARP